MGKQKYLIDFWSLSLNHFRTKTEQVFKILTHSQLLTHVKFMFKVLFQ